MDHDTAAQVEHAPGATAVDVYWRPGCGFCTSMRTALAEAGVEARWHNIWADPDAAAFVRSVARGNETMPTITLGDQVLVAPRPREVIGRLVEADPAAVADARRWPPLRIAQWATIAVLLVVANLFARAGHDGLSLVVDGVAVVAFFAYRRLRSRPRTGSHASVVTE